MIVSAFRNIRKDGLAAWLYKIWTMLLSRYFVFTYQLHNLLLTLSLKKTPVHYGVWGYKNAGDTSLYREVEDCFIKDSFLRRDLDKGEIFAKEVERINSRNTFLVLGGGGLFLKDSNKNQNSNWQFNISVENLRKINIPIILFAIGYNRFRNQEDFDGQFKSHLVETIEKALFVGLRNNGSIQALKTYLPQHLHDKLVLQPCPTTFIMQSHPEFNREIDISSPGNRTMAINIACDRLNKRFDGREDEVINSIIRLASSYQNKGWEVVFAGHTVQDRIIKQYIKKEFRFVDLTFKPLRRIYRFYNNIALTIGMRGHAQMIPFGLGNPVISLISHDKLKWFLDDIGHPEWGVEIKGEDMITHLEQKIEMILANYPEVNLQIRNSQEELKKITDRNIMRICSVINSL